MSAPLSVFLRRFTEADLLLFPTMIRFDTAYAVLFKCAKRRAKDYPHLFAWMRDVYQLPLPSPTQLQVSRESTVSHAYDASRHWLRFRPDHHSSSTQPRSRGR